MKGIFETIKNDLHTNVTSHVYMWTSVWFTHHSNYSNLNNMRYIRLQPVVCFSRNSCYFKNSELPKREVLTESWERQGGTYTKS